MSTIIRQHDIIQKLDFFNLYDLIKYDPKNPQYCSFLPIRIKNATMLDGGKSDKENNIDIDITLPWKVSEISDYVSVSYNKKGASAFGRLGRNMVGVAIENITSTLSDMTGNSYAEEIGNQLALLTVAEYNAGDLSKNLDLEFILPLVSDRAGVYNLDFIKSVRTALGALQGLVYPRAYGYLYPPLLKVELGGIYKGFKGFIREVSLRYSEEMIQIGEEMFPQIISGNIRFINIFTYSWDTYGDLEDLKNNFSLSKKPEILFGSDMEGGNMVNAGSITNTDKLRTKDGRRFVIPVEPKPLKEIALFEGRIKNLNIEEISDNNFDALAWNTNYIINNPNSILADFDKNSLDLLNQEQSKVLNIINDGNLDFLDIENFNDKKTIINSIKNVFDTIEDAHAYTNVLTNIKNGDLLGTLATVSRLTKTGNNMLKNSTYDLLNIVRSGSIILQHINSGINLSSAPYFYTDLAELIDYLNNIEIRKEEENKLYTGIFASGLKTENMINNINKVNITTKNILGKESYLSPIIDIYKGMNQQLVYDILTYGTTNINTTNKKVYEKTNEFYNNGKINKSVLLKIEDLYNETNNMDISGLNALSNNIFYKLVDLEDVLK